MYRRDLLAYLEFAQTREAALTSATLARWRTWLVQETKYSPTSINRMLSSVRATMEEAAQQAYISHELAQAFKQIRGVKVEALEDRKKKGAKTRISPEQMRDLCSSPGIDTLLGLRNTALLHTLASSGVRVSELVALTQDRLLQEGEFYFLEVKGKNDKTYRKAPLSREAYEAIQEWLQARSIAFSTEKIQESSLIFTRFRTIFIKGGKGKQELHCTDQTLSACAVWKMVQGQARECGLNHIKPHDFRRFMVTTTIKKHGLRQANRAAGHKQIQTTVLYDLGDLEPGLTENAY